MSSIPCLMKYYTHFFWYIWDCKWNSSTERIPFPTLDGKTWEDYVKDTRLEVSCGEAPYLVSRYGVVSGIDIDIKDRIGILDRKLRVIFSYERSN